MAVVTDRDFGWKKFRQNIAEMDGQELIVGFTEGEIATIAFWNEMGTVHIPARPFMRTTVDDNAQNYAEQIARDFRREMLKSGGVTSSLVKLGVRVRNDIIKGITRWKEPANRPSTVAQKGANNPLVDTGRMRGSVTFEIRGSGG